MPTEFLNDLYQWNPVMDPIFLRMQEETAVTGTGTRGGIAFAFSDFPPDGSTWTLTTAVPALTTTVNFVNTVTDPDTEILLDTGMALGDWVRDVLVPFFQGLYSFSQIREVSYDPALPESILFSVRSAFQGNADPITSSIEVGFSLTSTETAGSDIVVDGDTRIVMRLMVENLNTVVNLEADVEFFDIAAELVFTPNPLKFGIVEIDLADWLKEYVGHKVTNWNATGFQLLTRGMARFKVTAGRRYFRPYDAETQTGGYTDYGRMAVTPVANAYAAGRSVADRTTNPDWKLERTTNDDGEPLIRFLSNWNNLSKRYAKKVTSDQPEFLVFIPTVDYEPGDIAVRGQMTATDGVGTGTGSLYTNANPLKAGYVYYFRFTALAVMQLFPTKVAHIVRVHVADVSDPFFPQPITETRYYLVDWDHHRNKRFLHYFGGLGGIDTIALFGQRTTTIEPTIDNSGRQLVQTDMTKTAEQSDSVTTYRGYVDEHECGTQYLTVEEMRAVQDLLLSDNIVEMDEQGMIRPVVLTAKKFDTIDESENLRSLKVTYRYATQQAGLSLMHPAQE